MIPEMARIQAEERTMRLWEEYKKNIEQDAFYSTYQLFEDLNNEAYNIIFEFCSLSTDEHLRAMVKVIMLDQLRELMFGKDRT